VTLLTRSSRVGGIRSRKRASVVALEGEIAAYTSSMALKGSAVNGKSLKSGLPAALLIASVAGQALAQEGECPKVDAEVNVKALGIVYYPPAKTVGNFVPAVTVGKVMYLAGNGPKMPDGKFVIGKLGSGPGQLSVEQGYQASKFAAISLLDATSIHFKVLGTHYVWRSVCPMPSRLREDDGCPVGDNCRVSPSNASQTRSLSEAAAASARSFLVATRN
jgi:hypothetical protein